MEVNVFIIKLLSSYDQSVNYKCPVILFILIYMHLIYFDTALRIIQFNLIFPKETPERYCSLIIGYNFSICSPGLIYQFVQHCIYRLWIVFLIH